MEESVFKKIVNLHSIPAFREIDVYEGVKLRPLASSDATRILEILAADSSIRRNVSVASQFHMAKDISKEIEKYRKDKGLIRYTILEGDNPIGLVSFWRDDGFWGKPNINDYGFGYFLDPSKRGKGIVTNALQRLIDIAKQNVYVRQFVAFCSDNNNESIAILIKLGFKPTNKTFSEPNNGWIERKYVKLVA